MPRIRTIKPKFWDDLKIAKLSRDARLIFIGTWNFADDNGVIIGDQAWLKSKILPFDTLTAGTFDKWLKELESLGMLTRITYREETFYHIASFTHHQVINRPNYEEAFIPKEELDQLLEQKKNDHGPITEPSVQEGKGKEGKGKGKGREETAKAFTPPTLEEVKAFFLSKGYTESLAARFFESYNTANQAGQTWIDSRGNKVKNWKQKALMVWMREDNRQPSKTAKHDIADHISKF